MMKKIIFSIIALMLMVSLSGCGIFGKGETIGYVYAGDVAEQGLDETVILWGVKKLNRYQVLGWYSEAKSDAIYAVVEGIKDDFVRGYFTYYVSRLNDAGVEFNSDMRDELLRVCEYPIWGRENEIQ